MNAKIHLLSLDTITTQCYYAGRREPRGIGFDSNLDVEGFEPNNTAKK